MHRNLPGPGGEQLFRPGEPPIAPAPPEAVRAVRATTSVQRKPRFAPITTSVGAPTKRIQELARRVRLRPQIIALLIASLVLILLVSQVINLPGGSTPTPTSVVTPTPPLLLDPIRIPVPTLMPTPVP